MGNTWFELAKAFNDFGNAWVNLVKLTSKMPDLDLRQAYPFFLLDFEEIVDNVKLWCTLHASRCLENLPKTVTNPACLVCKTPDACTSCVNSQTIVFTREAVTPYLLSRGYKITAAMPDSIVHAAYIGEMNRHATANSTTGDESTPTTTE